MLRVHLVEDKHAVNPPVPVYAFDGRDALFIVPFTEDGALIFIRRPSTRCLPCGQSYNAPCPYCEGE